MSDFDEVSSYLVVSNTAMCSLRHAIYGQPLEPLTPVSNTFADGFLLLQ